MEQFPVVIPPSVATSPEFLAAASLVGRLHDAGHQAYLIGGCVRDTVLGYTPKDFDIVTSARPEQTQELFPRSLALGAQFGVITVLVDDLQFDVATFRREGGYEDGRRPSWVEYADLDADTRRRDFTINGMAYDLAAGRVIDLCGGMQDLKAGIVRTIGAPAERFSEDALRVVRAVRFASRFGFTIEVSTRAALVAAAPSLERVARERVWQELEPMMQGPGRVEAFRLLVSLDLLPPVFGPDVTIPPDAVERTAQRLAALPLQAPTCLPFACLLADALAPGDPADHAGKTSDPYDDSANRRARDVLQSLRAPRAVSDTVAHLLARRWVWAAGATIREGRLAQLIRNDTTGSLVAFWKTDAASFGYAAGVDRILTIAARLEREGKMPGGPGKPPVTGALLTEAGIPCDAGMGRLIAEAERLWLEGGLETSADVQRWLDEVNGLTGETAQSGGTNRQG